MRPEDITPEQASAWREREASRLANGTYTPLPKDWTFGPWFHEDGDIYKSLRYPDHYAHVSIDKLAMIAFTENDRKGVADRQTRINPGRYLARFFSDVLTKTEIQNLAAQMGADYNDDAELHFAKTPDEIEEVYTEGPDSCMSHEPDHFDSSVHPSRVYAGFDLELAYLKREERITARALVWPEKRIHSRIYGDSIRMIKALNDAGYTEDTLDGARITKLFDGDSYVIPYLDYLKGATDECTHLMLWQNRPTGGRHLCCVGDRQNGLSEDAGPDCSACGTGLVEDDAYTHDGDSYCDNCYSERWATCDRSGRSVERDELREVRVRSGSRWHTELWSERSCDSHAFFCEERQVWYSDAVESYDVDGDTWGPEAFGDYGVEIDGDYFDTRNLPDDVELPEKTEPQYVEVQVNQQVLPLFTGNVSYEPPPFAIGDWVIAIDSIDGQFTSGQRYQVSQVHPTHISVAADDSGERNGWCLDKFIRDVTPLLSEPGLHVRHETGTLWPYKVFYNNLYLDGFSSRAAADEYLLRLREDVNFRCDTIEARERAPLYYPATPLPATPILADDPAALHIRHEPSDDCFPWKVFFGDLYLDGWHRDNRADAGEFLDALRHDPDRLRATIERRRRLPLRPIYESAVNVAPEEVA